MGRRGEWREAVPSEGVCLRPLQCLDKVEVMGPETNVQPSEHVDFRATARGLSGTRARGRLGIRDLRRYQAATPVPRKDVQPQPRRERRRCGQIAEGALGETQTGAPGQRTPATGNENVDHTAMCFRPPPKGPVVRSTV